ncbi:MAG: hypothetical protein WC900_06470 [Oscillospiraceae bacterium]|jgi:hypothetical protein
MKTNEEYGKEKAYELEKICAKIVQEEIKISKLSLREFATKFDISFGILKHAILVNLNHYCCGNDLKSLTEILKKLGYEIEFKIKKG